MKILIHLLLLLLYSSASFGQEGLLKVDLSPIDNVENYGVGLSPVYEITSRAKLYHNKKRYKINLPDSNSEFGITFVYFNETENNKIPKSIPLVIEDFKSNNPGFYLDANNNLNFTDDGGPVRFKQDSINIRGVQHRYIDFLINNKRRPGNPYKLYIVEPVDTSGMNFLKNHIRAGKNETPANVEHWFFEIRFNKIAGQVKIENDTFQIIFEDNNVNTIYGDKGDFIITKKLNEKGSKQDNWKISQETIIKLGNSSFAFQKIDSLERSAVFTGMENSTKLRFHNGDTIENFQIKLVDGSVKQLEEYFHQDKYLLLYFWGTWCAGCRQRTPMLKELYEIYNNNLEIIGFANDRKLSAVKDYIKKNEIKWINAVADKNMLVKLNIIGYPSFVLLNEKGEIIKDQSNIEEIKSIVE